MRAKFNSTHLSLVLSLVLALGSIFISVEKENYTLSVVFSELTDSAQFETTGHNSEPGGLSINQKKTICAPRSNSEPGGL